jgi:hypothetical protein
MAAHARASGGTAVINMRFDHRNVSEMWMEICAYGTCVIAEPLPVLARRARTMWSLRTRANDGGPLPLPAGGSAGGAPARERRRALRNRLP